MLSPEVMEHGIFFDTETTGIPQWKEPSGGENQPHIVSVSALKVNLTTRKVVAKFDEIVKPDGWTIPDEVIEIHGISNEMAAEKGRPENKVLTDFMDLWLMCGRRFAHNTTFDNRIICIGLKRYMDDVMQDEWKASDYTCTMSLARKVIGGKNPTLGDAYQFFMGKPLEGAHNSLVDAWACMDIFFAMKDRASKEVI